MSLVGPGILLDIVLEYHIVPLYKQLSQLYQLMLLILLVNAYSQFAVLFSGCIMYVGKYEVVLWLQDPLAVYFIMMNFDVWHTEELQAVGTAVNIMVAFKVLDATTEVRKPVKLIKQELLELKLSQIKVNSEIVKVVAFVKLEVAESDVTKVARIDINVKEQYLSVLRFG
jgi:hypothetical protein